MTQSYRVRDFYDAAKIEKDHFVQRYSYPFLIWLGKHKTLTCAKDENGEFYTTVLNSPTLHEQIAIDLGKMLDPDFTVFPLIKRTSILPGSKQNPAVIMVGRASNNDVVLPFANISKSHFYITTNPFTADRYTLIDSDSTNGTRVNNKSIAPHTRVPIEDGDVITLGPDVFLKFFLPSGLWENLQNIPSHFDESL